MSVTACVTYERRVEKPRAASSVGVAASHITLAQLFLSCFPTDFRAKERLLAVYLPIETFVIQTGVTQTSLSTYRIRTAVFAASTQLLELACVASVSVKQRAKNGVFGVLPATKSERFFVSRTQNLYPQQMLCAQANGEKFVSAPMCPQECVLVCRVCLIVEG